MKEMISVAPGYQYSVNIAYDLNNDEKLRSFIPTRSSLKLLEAILRSTEVSSTERARILIGAYGKGKSHIVLTILSMLLKKDRNLFEKLTPKIKENSTLYQAVENYYSSPNKILPVIISGSNTSLTQAFLLALERTLSENNLWDVMPETNYKAAINVITRWKNEYPDVFERFNNAIRMPANSFIENLRNYDLDAYNKFEQIYPSLTGGSSFNPFLGFDVIELYESVAKSIREKGYTGLFIVYDEFSKYLESNIASTSVSDTKMLQDFAEKCNRSKTLQMHIMLISHKEISNYIDILPKQKTDGWRGVSERFLHVHLNNNFSQTYEIISSVILKDKSKWEEFCHQYNDIFKRLTEQYSKHAIFSDTSEEDFKHVIYDCYPLHPVSTFILPRLSERVAQNERTLFTFLSADGYSTLPSFLKTYNEKEFRLITPDVIFDYFEPLLRKEIYSGDLYNTYVLTTEILEKIEPDSLEAKIIKTISLIYILEQYEKLKPSVDELIGIYSSTYSVEEIKLAVSNLAEKDYVVYLKRSNNFLKLKQTSGVNIHQQISDTIALIKPSLSLKKSLNNVNFDNYMYPSRYNDNKEMTRYFSFQFIDEDEVSENTNWEIKSEGIDGDGIIYAIRLNNPDSLERIEKDLLSSSKNQNRFIFVLPKDYEDISNTILEFEAVKQLRQQAAEDKTLFDEYEVIYEDLFELVTSYIYNYTHPETYKSIYIHNGERQKISRKSELTELISRICEQVFCLTPIINNEAINKNEITSMAANSRRKIISGLLRSETEQDLGLVGTGQDVSIMRSTLLRTKILVNHNGFGEINLRPGDKFITNMLSVITEFIENSKYTDQVCFADLYDKLILPAGKIGLRRGIVPIYIAAVFHVYKQQIIIKNKYGQMPVSADSLLQIDANPQQYYLSYINWNASKEEYVKGIENIFIDHVVPAEKATSSYDFVVSAMKRWYLSLPKYTRESQRNADGETINKKYTVFLRQLRSNNNAYDFLFTKIPDLFGYTTDQLPGLINIILETRKFFDTYLDKLRITLIEFISDLLSTDKSTAHETQIILSNWKNSLDPDVFEQIFTDGTEKFLNLLHEDYVSDEYFISKLAKIASGLRIEDWNDSTLQIFKNQIQNYKQTAESYHKTEILPAVDNPDNNYQVTFVNDDGIPTVKRFEKVEISNRGRLLYNTLTADLDSMGTSISESEKRQILMDVLKKIC